MPPDADSDTRDTNDAFRPSSPWWGSMLCPVAVVTGRMDTPTKSASMNHLSLFSGSGIGTLAAAEVGIRTVAHAENDPACRYCLERLWPDARLFRDVRDVTAESVADLGPIDIISGGFPCTDISTAGKGAGLGTEEEPTRSGLWYEFARVIRETQPTWLLIENVPALRVRGGDRVCEDLEAMAYEWEAVVVGADDVGAPHRRKRVWIVAHREVIGRPKRGLHQGRTQKDGHGTPDALRVSEGMGHAPSNDERRAPIVAMHGAGESAGGSGGGELAYSNSTRPPQPMCQPINPRQEQSAIIRSRWPARPGEPQHDWEAPRLVEFGVGDAVDGLPRRIRSRANKALLRMVGNAWCYQNAVLMFRAIMELSRQ